MFAKIENNQVVSTQTLRRDMFDIPSAGYKSLTELKELGILPLMNINDTHNKYQNIHLKEYQIKDDLVEAHYVVTDKPADVVRKIKESESFVEYGDGKINLTDKAIYNLQAYILSDIQLVEWKCDNDVFVTLTMDDMEDILKQLMLVRAELYSEEHYRKEGV